MKANPSAPEGLALQGASAALRGLAVESTTAGAARLASAPLQSQRGSRGILRQAPEERADSAIFQCCSLRAKWARSAVLPHSSRRRGCTHASADPAINN